MKSYNHLMEQFLSPDNYYLAVKNATKHKSFRKRKYRKAQKLAENAETMMPLYLEYAEHYKNAKHTPKTIYDGVQRKQRQIIVPTIREQVVHHMAINVLKPIFMRSMYEHSYGSIPSRGAHGGKRTIEKWIRNGGRDMKYCLKMDIRHFFDSIDHDILKAKLRKLIRDDTFLRVLYEIVDVTENGIPLGFYTSQWFANWFLQDFDHYVKEQLHAKYYIRYMDDIVIFDGNKRRLHEMFKAIREYLLDKLHLEVKSNWQIFQFDYVRRNGEHVGRDLDFMGFRFYRDRTTIRKSIMLKASRKARRACKKLRKTVHDCRQMLSYLGWVDCTNTYQMYKRWIKPYICFRQLKKRVGDYERRRNHELEKNRIDRATPAA